MREVSAILELAPPYLAVVRRDSGTHSASAGDKADKDLMDELGAEPTSKLLKKREVVSSYRS